MCTYCVLFVCVCVVCVCAACVRAVCVRARVCMWCACVWCVCRCVVCVCVGVSALVIRHVKAHLFCAALYTHTCPAPLYLITPPPHHLTHDTIWGVKKKPRTQNVCFDCLYNFFFFRRIFHSKRNSATSSVRQSACKVPAILVRYS